MLYIAHIYTMKDSKNIIKDIYGNEIPAGISFTDYWDQQHKLEALSNAESIRQKEERKSRMSTPTDAVSAKNGVRVKKE
jgi:hypothetical protein